MSVDSSDPAPGAIAAWERHAGTTIDPHALRATLAAGTLPEAFHRAALEGGEKLAVSIEGASATYRELDAAAGRTAAWLLSRGVDTGERVLLCGPNSLAFVVGYLGALRAGAAVVLASAELTERELGHMAVHSGAVAPFAAGAAHGRLRGIAARTALDPVIGLDHTESPTLEEASAGPETLQPPALDADAVAVIGYTSGTTGAPKGAALSHANVLASLRGAMLAWRWAEGDVLVHTLPMSHQHGMAGLQATLLAGSTAVIQHGLDPAALCAAVERERATVLFSVPAIYERLVSWGKATRGQFASLRLATSGSAPLAPKPWHRAAELLGSEPLERYGTTESGLDVSNPYDGPRKPGAVGIPLPGLEMRVVDAEGEAVEAGADGEVVVRGPQVFRGYWADERASHESFHPGRWFRTGDVGRIDPSDGYLSITGRIKDLIISGGMNVYPREVELVLEQHPAVGRAAVVGVPSERWGEVVVAFVVPAEAALDSDEIREHARRLLAPYKSPKAVLETDALPFDGFGKLRRTELVEMAKEELD